MKAKRDLRQRAGNTSNHLVSIMMPAYNAEAYIGEAIQSVIDQSYPHWELLVVDDGSEDATAKVVRSFDDQRIQLIQQSNQGEAEARNRALGAMSGQFLAFLDADDRFLPEHLDLTVDELLQSPEFQAVYTDGYRIDSLGHRLGTLSEERRGPFSGDIFEEVLRASDVFGPPICVLIRSDFVLANNLEFDPGIVIGPDWDFMLRVAESGHFSYLDKQTCEYRIHEENISFTTSNRRRMDSLARCRSRAIQLPRFGGCSIETRTYAFYDLLINQLLGKPERQNEILQWKQFMGLPKPERSRLLRLMAATSLAAGVDTHFIASWIKAARDLDPRSLKAAILNLVFQLSPTLSRSIMTRRHPFRINKGLAASKSAESV